MESLESFITFCYSTYGKNPTWTASEFIFLSALQSVQNCSFQQTHRRANRHRTWTTGQMKEIKYRFESCWSPLPFWYLTLSQISDRTAPDLKFLAAACSQGRWNVDARSFHLDALLWDGAWQLPVVLLQSMHLFIILLPVVRSFSPIKFLIKILSKFALYGRFLFLWTLRAPSSNLGWVTVWSSHLEVVSCIAHSCSIY
jgi:hypothetical protein